MSNKSESVNWSATGWAFLGLLSLFAWMVTMIGQLVGVAWYFPWIFFGLFVFLVVKTSKVRRKAAEKPVEGDYKLPHLVSVPGKYVRQPCENPEWISIPLYRDYEIHCSSLQVRNKFTGDIIPAGYDPEGKHDGAYIELMNGDNMQRYVRLDWIVESALGRGHVTNAQNH